GAGGRIHTIGQDRAGAVRRGDLVAERDQAGVGVGDVEARLLAGARRGDRRDAAARRSAGGRERGRELVRTRDRPALVGRVVRGVEDLDVAFDIVSDVDVELAVDLEVIFVFDQ